ncbi:DNRLRE domain-containing protein [Pontiella sulfatireligans]|uniref:Protease 1 n=1 Tax=Pontiella sulfatireligans TaxID=2750658 RepID=A0A6C2UFQ0_9BACT|nr:DNRLRE domain-containing protein [Pontiella sulfatireligans]VGO18357.1 Protease 1 [Pontiella sulfatireligans]
MKNLLHTTCLLAGLPLTSALASDFFVSPTGSDTNNGSFAQPFASIQKAANTMFSGDTCHIRAGTYRETVAPPRSGTSTLPIRYQAYSNESVIVTGLDLVSGWSLLSNGIYQCAAPTEVTQLFSDGELMVEARWPNTDTDYLSPTLALVDSASMGAYNQPSTLTDAGLAPFPDGHWNGAKMWYLPGSQWGAGSTTITSHSGNQLDFLNTSKVSALQIETNSKYFLYGTLNALNVQKEWFHDAGQLYFKAPGAANPSGLSVEARTRRYGFDLGWRNYTEIQGLTLRAATITMKGEHNLVEDCSILHPTPFFDAAIWQGDDGVELHGQNNTIRRSEIAWSWGDGVSLNNSAVSNTVENCLIHDCNWGGGWSAPIRTLGTGHAFLGNTIYNSGRSGIRFQKATRLRIEKNHISHMGWLTKDLGAIKTGGTDGLDTVIAYNWVRDHNSAAWCTGIYLDNSSTNHIVHHNAVWNFDNGIRMNKFGTGLYVYNNTMFNSAKESMAHYAPGGETYDGVLTYNNLCTTGPFRGTDLQNNLQDDPANILYAGTEHGDFRTLENSTAIDYGRNIPGYTEGHAGAAPDAGAYEFGGADWIAGIDWTPDWNALPIPAFTISGTTFDASPSTDADGFIMRYDWDFGDGTTAYGKTASHSFATTGTYSVVLTVMDELNGTRQTTNSVTIGAAPVVGIFNLGTDLFMESDGTKHDTDTLLAGKPQSGTNVLDSRRAFLQFDLSALLAEPISNAVLRLYHIEGENDTWGNAQIYPVTSNWTAQTVTYSHPVGSSLGVLVGKDGPFNQYHEMNITPLVQSWQNDLSSNHGISLRGAEPFSLTAKYFQSLEGVHPPQLKITYATTSAGVPVSEAAIEPQAIPALTWFSTTEAYYTIERSTNLVSGEWLPVGSAIEATPPANTFHDHSSTNAAFPLFYRVSTP